MLEATGTGGQAQISNNVENVGDPTVEAPETEQNGGDDGSPSLTGSM